MTRLLDRLLKGYDPGNYALYQKARFMLIGSGCMLLANLIVFMYSFYLQKGNFNSIIMAELVLLLFLASGVAILIRGRYNVALHIMLVTGNIAVWLVVMTDESFPLSKYDSLFILMALLSSLSLINLKYRKIIFIYALLNCIIVPLSVYLSPLGVALTRYEQTDYIADSIISILFITALAYNIVALNGRTLDRAQVEISEREKTEAQLIHANERLQRLIGDLEAANEEFESQNEELAGAYEEIKISQERFSKMIGLSPFPVIIFNRMNEIDYINREFTQVLGYGQESLKTSDDFIARAFPDGESRSRFSDALGRMIGSAPGGDGFGQSEWSVMCGDGVVRIMEIMGVDIGGASMIIMNDLSERIMAREIMVQNEKMMTVGSMAAGMAHEINNPLSVIMQSIQMIQARISDGVKGNLEAADRIGVPLEKVREYLGERNVLEYLEGIRDAGLRSSRIISNMLQFSRKKKSEAEPVDINALIDSSIEISQSEYDVKKRYDLRKIDIIRSYDASLPMVHCNPGEIEQVMINLLKNSAQAISENDGIMPEISIRTSMQGEDAVLEITDNGPGIDPEILKHIFVPFYTTKQPGYGTGLGLAVCYFIITRNHGGQISVTSEPGKGTTFIITLPIKGAGHGTEIGTDTGH